MSFFSKWPVQPFIGLGVGTVIAYVDSYAFEGEVSPIVIVAMLFTATAIAGTLWRWRGWIASCIAWACVPLAHVIKHILGLPDTLHPNTYTSILMLAAFTFDVATVGTGCGVLFRRFTTTLARAKTLGRSEERGT